VIDDEATCGGVSGGMSSAVVARLAALSAAVDELLLVDLSRESADGVLGLVRALEVQRRRLDGVDQRVVAELDRRAVAADVGYRDTTGLLCGLLRLDPAEARRRVAAAGELTPRVLASGAVIEAVLPVVADAVAHGAISAGHVRVISRLLTDLPHGVTAVRDREIEAELVEHARQFAPAQLATLARRMRDHYDPDGRISDDEDRARRRHVSCQPHPDGTVSGTFCTDAVTGEALLTFLDAAARPVLDESGQRDGRTSGQRRHDALSALLLSAIRDGLPDGGGVSATIVLTLTAEQALTGQGLAATGHGALLSLPQLRQLIADARIHPVSLDAHGGITGNGHTRRLFTEGQRLALIARDKGCSFPGCTVGAAWCDTHHVREHAQGGPTTLSNGTLLCRYHHHHFDRHGWSCHMRGGVPHWTPPRWIDPSQTPRRNAAHL
jgi:hypothetical protein